MLVFAIVDHRAIAAADPVDVANGTEIFREAAEAIAQHSKKPITVSQIAEQAAKDLLYKLGGEAQVADGIASLAPDAAIARFGQILGSQSGAGPGDGASPATLAEQAIALFCRALDPYSEYCNSATFSLYSRQKGGPTAGVGISLLARDGSFYCYPLPGSPAEKAGVKNGDLLLNVAGRDITRSSLLEIGALVRGEPGTRIELGLKRSYGREDSVAVMRELQTIPVVLVQKEFGETTIRLRQITPKSVEELRAALAGLVASNAKNVTLDLRGSPGGDFDSIIALADLFLATGAPIGSLVERNSITPYYARDPEQFQLEKISILQDAGTASAAEFLICCLMENFGSQQVSTHGEKTFGKSAVITRIPPLRGGGQLMITSGELYAPSGRTWEGTGLFPSLDNNGQVFAASVRPHIAALQRQAPDAAVISQTPSVSTPTLSINASSQSGVLSGPSIPIPPPTSSPGQTPIQPPQPSAGVATDPLSEPIQVTPVGKGSGRF
jgi:carboxyl-terminal processing protease